MLQPHAPLIGWTGMLPAGPAERTAIALFDRTWSVCGRTGRHACGRTCPPEYAELAGGWFHWESLCRADGRMVSLGGHEHLRGRSPVADRGMRADPIVVTAPALDDDLCFALG